MAECLEKEYAVALGSATVPHWHACPGKARRVCNGPFQDTEYAGAPVGGASKRIFDVLLALVLFPWIVVVGLPVACLIAIGGGSPIYGQLRVGRNARLFRCYKFRTMNSGAEQELQRILERDPAARLQWLERFKLPEDPRVTRLGRLLRRTNFDELPQIWNVLRGDMSWVGPRPVVPDELNKYGVNTSTYLACRPGITGLWQICRRNDTTYERRVAFDAEYARKWSMIRDVYILIMTAVRITNQA